jgi:Heparan-alpha-glucosaminide N-acetyltransferase, catalytic
MVLVHFVIYYGNEAAMGLMLYFVMNNVHGNVGAAGFLALAGMSHPLAVDGRVLKAAAAGRTWRECDELRCAWRRSLKLLSVELLMLALAWGPRDMIKWDILTLQATSTHVLYVCRRVPSRWPLQLFDPCRSWILRRRGLEGSESLPSRRSSPPDSCSIRWLATSRLAGTSSPLLKGTCSRGSSPYSPGCCSR